MSLLKRNQADVQLITSNKKEFGVDLFFQAPTGETASVSGYCSDHSLTVDDMGNAITGKRTTVVFGEQLLADLNYPTRNSKNQVVFLRHLVTVSYVDGRIVKYAIAEWRPDYLVNLITLFLEIYNGID